MYKLEPSFCTAKGFSLNFLALSYPRPSRFLKFTNLDPHFTTRENSPQKINFLAKENIQIWLISYKICYFFCIYQKTFLIFYSISTQFEVLNDTFHWNVSFFALFLFQFWVFFFSLNPYSCDEHVVHMYMCIRGTCNERKQLHMYIHTKEIFMGKEKSLSFELHTCS